MSLFKEAGTGTWQPASKLLLPDHDDADASQRMVKSDDCFYEP
jgi:hypothetical protein